MTSADQASNGPSYVPTPKPFPIGDESIPHVSWVSSMWVVTRAKCFPRVPESEVLVFLFRCAICTGNLFVLFLCARGQMEVSVFPLNTATGSLGTCTASWGGFKGCRRGPTPAEGQNPSFPQPPFISALRFGICQSHELGRKGNGLLT